MITPRTGRSDEPSIANEAAIAGDSAQFTSQHSIIVMRAMCIKICIKCIKKFTGTFMPDWTLATRRVKITSASSYRKPQTEISRAKRINRRVIFFAL